MFLIHKSPRQVRGDLFFSLRAGGEARSGAQPLFFKDANGILKK